MHKPTTGIDLLRAPQLFDLHSMHSMTNSGRKTNTWMQIFTPPAAPLQSFPPVIPRFPPEAYSAFRSGAPKLSSSGGFHIGGSESWRGLDLRGSRGQNGIKVDKDNNSSSKGRRACCWSSFASCSNKSLKEWTDPDCGLEAISIVPTKQGWQMNKDWVDRFDRHDIHTKIMCPNCMHTPNCYVMVMC